MSNVPQADLLPGDRVIQCEEILKLDDPVFEPKDRPLVEDALKASSGKVGNRIVPFASGSFEHHADIPEQNLFRCLFGRDSLIISSLLSARKPDLQIETVLALAEHQGEQVTAASEEEPGRIPHEVREKHDPQAHEIFMESGWEFPYYGSIDATLLWLISLAEIAEFRPEILDTEVSGKKLSSRAELAAHWVLNRLESGAGYIRSQRTNPKGILNQVWKDSGDSFLTKSGQVALSEGTVAIETIAQTYDALLAAASLASTSNFRWSVTPEEFRSLAEQSRSLLLNDWWLGDYFAMGLGEVSGSEVLLDAVASNQWRLLDSKILHSAEFESYSSCLVNSVTDPDVLGPHGIRTLSKSNPRYRPGGYHTGSSWPMDAALITRGLLRHEALAEAKEVSAKTVRAIESVGGYPELFRSDVSELSGVSRHVIDVLDPETGGTNRVSQPPQLLQGWTIASYAWFEDVNLASES